MAKHTTSRPPKNMADLSQERSLPLDRPAKRVKLLDNSDDDESDSEDGGVALKVNEDYAKRFEHNKKRAEMHRLEEKYGKSKAMSNGTTNKDEAFEDEDSESEDEDDEGELVTEDLDAEISATLQAIRAKDPRVYDKTITFYHEADDDDDGAAGTNGVKREKSMTLKDYHTKNLLEGKFETEADEAEPPRTYAQEQEDARQNLVKEMHQAAEDDSEDEGDFLIAKSKPQPTNGATKSRVQITEEDVQAADKDPETFLSNFMASRAWVPTPASKFQPFESDDEDEDARADDFEDAYNRYFEDPNATNEKLVTYARDTVASSSVRREEASGRRKAREAARAKREAERREREEDIARLRKLKIEEMEDKVKKIRKTAGLSGRDFNMEEWAGVLEADWSDDQWDAEMHKRFGDAYYETNEAANTSESEEGHGNKSKKLKKPKKPKWDDDIDIHDLIPDFKDEETAKPPFSLSSDEEDNGEAEVEEANDPTETKRAKTSKQRKQERAEAKSAARRDRRLIERLVDQNLEYDVALASNSKAPAQFRYRETSPTNFGLTARDILLANDSQLNQFAGLKKMATFRDPVKKKKDKKNLSKKARLREWRKETFGDEEGPKGGFETLLGDEGTAIDDVARRDVNGSVDIRDGEGKKKKKRSRKRKAASLEG